MSKDTNCMSCFHYDICEKADDGVGNEGCEHEVPIADVKDALKTTELKRKSKWIAHLKEQIARERAATKGYEELAKLQCAYITILLHKLNATEDNAVTITKKEVTRAMSDFEARAFTDKDGGMNLYCVDYKKD